MRQYAPAIDRTFLGLLAANIKSAEEQNATAAVNRLRQIYEIGMKIFDESLPPEMHLMQQLALAKCLPWPKDRCVKRGMRSRRIRLSRFVGKLL